MIELVLVDYDPNDPSSCDNAGAACFGCPAFDRCDHHFDDDPA